MDPLSPPVAKITEDEFKENDQTLLSDMDEILESLKDAIKKREQTTTVLSNVSPEKLKEQKKRSITRIETTANKEVRKTFNEIANLCNTLFPDQPKVREILMFDLEMDSDTEQDLEE